MTNRRFRVLVPLVGVIALAGCSSGESVGDGFVLVDIETISLCEEIAAETPPRCVGTILTVPQFSLLDSSNVTLAGRPPINYSTERVRLVRTDSDRLEFELQPIDG